MQLKAPQPTFLENLSSFSVPVVIIPAEFENAPALQLPPSAPGRSRSWSSSRQPRRS
jgi:hypothetical protein